jgi:hypothetical protein
VGKGGQKETRPCRIDLYQGGYVDISPLPANPEYEQLERWPAPYPSRKSLFDDILFYWSQADSFPGLHRHLRGDAATMFMYGTSFFLKRIIASHWMQFLVYFDEIIDRLEYALARADIKALDGVENHLADVEFWQRRCRKSREQIEQALDTLQKIKSSLSGGSGEAASSGCDNAIYGCVDDFTHIHKQISVLQERCQRLIQSLAYVVSIIESKQSSEEAHNLRILTVLGMLFVPLTLMSGIFSMSDRFQPGAEYFWVYFVTSLPIVGLVFSVVFGKQIAETLGVKKKSRRTLLNVKLTARLGVQEHGAVDIEKGKRYNMLLIPPP